MITHTNFEHLVILHINRAALAVRISFLKTKGDSRINGKQAQNLSLEEVAALKVYDGENHSEVSA